MSVEFDTPANRIIAQIKPNKFSINTSLPDISFLRQLAVQGRMRYFQGTHTTDITITPTIGETLFIGGGSWVGLSAASTLTVRNAGNLRESILISTTSGYSSSFQFGLDSLVGDGIKQFVVAASAATVSFNIWGWVENTSRIRDVTT